MAEKLHIKKVDGKLPVLSVDGRTTPRAPHKLNLQYARDLPVHCNDCKYRPIEEGGKPGGCTVYKQDGLCSIRSDVRKQMQVFGTDQPDHLKQLIQAEVDRNFEFIQTMHSIEDMVGELNTEVTKRMNAITNMGKLLNEMNTKKNTIEIEERHTLTDDMKEQIARTIRLTQEKKDEN